MKRNSFCVTTNDMLRSPHGHQEKIMDFNYREEYLKVVYQTKYYYGSVKKSTFSFHSDLHIDKKINNVKEDPRKKTDSNFDFSQAMSRTACHRTLFTPKEAELGR